MKIKQLLSNDDLTIAEQSNLLSAIARFRLYLLKNPEAKKASKIYENLLKDYRVDGIDKLIDHTINCGCYLFEKKDAYDKDIVWEIIIELDDQNREEKVLSALAAGFRESDICYD